jgi:hypothetical protein
MTVIAVDDPRLRIHRQMRAFAMEGEEPSTWPEPERGLLHERRLPAPELPLDVFGPTWAPWIRTAAAAASCPGDYVAAALLVAAAGSIGNARWGSPWRGWREPPILNVGAVGLPSSGKSPGQAVVTNAYRDFERDLGVNHPETRREWEAAKRAAKLRRAAWEQEVKAAVDAGESPPPMPADGEEPPKPERPRLFTTDATSEALAALLAGNPRGLVLIRDELAGWIGQMDKYGAGNGGSDRAFWLEAYDGRGFTVDRVKYGGDAVYIPHLSVSVLGSIQPDRLASLLLAGDDDGMAARFLYLWPERVPPRRPRSVPDGDLLPAAFRRLRSLQMTKADDGSLRPVVLRMTEAASERLQAFREQVAEKEQAAEGLYLSWLGKSPGRAVRLALILELLWWAGDPNAPEPAEIGEAATLAARALLDGYLIPMAVRTFGEAALPLPERDAAALARWIVRQHPVPEVVNARELRIKAALPTRQPERYDLALAELVEPRRLRPAPGRAGDNAGRRRKDFEVNPAVAGFA